MGYEERLGREDWQDNIGWHKNQQPQINQLHYLNCGIRTFRAGTRFKNGQKQNDS